MQTIAAVESENPENQLTVVRNHLLALGKTEGQLKELREKSVDSSPTTEYSIVEVLQLWQKIFKDTFHQYHRLSSRLVQSQDNASALKLWHEYLQHVQSFLSSAIPEDYSSLTEHRHLCNVHQNLLVSQQSVLQLKSEHSNVDPTVLEQFNSLTNLHNETLSRILDRHSEIEMRLSAWNKYRKDQAQLLEWLKEKERERSRLQLKYIHLRRVPKVLHRIERIIEQMPQGENDAENLRKQQSNFLHFCDDAIATSIRMEHAANSQRITNLRAGLETWRDFLEKIVNLSKTYDEKVKFIQTNFHDAQGLVTNTANNLPTNSMAIQERLGQLRNQRVRLNNLTPELESISVIQEELKECISPFDMKTIRQMVWILWQQQADLDQQLSSLVNQIEERLSLNEVFSAKYDRLMNWMDGIEKRLDSDSQSMLNDPEDVIKRIEKEVQSEMELREHEREWLLFNGQELISFYGGNSKKEQQIRQEIQTKLDNTVDRWERLKYLCKSRSTKISDLKITMLRLEERIAEIRSWLYSMEVELLKPIVFESTHKSVIEKKLKEHDKIQRAIEGESSNIGDVLNLCEMLLSDVDTWKAHFNTTALTSSVENLERRWKNVCGLSAERKRKILNTWSLLLELLQLTSDQDAWLVDQENNLNDLEQRLDDLSKDEVQERIAILEAKIIEIESRSSIFKSLEQTYSKLAKTSGLEPENVKQLTTSTRFMLIRWRALVPKALDIIGMLNMDMKMYREFISCHDRAMETLTQIQSNYNEIKTTGSTENPDDQLAKVQYLEQELKMCENDLANADKLGLVMMKKGRPDEIQSIQSLIDEYQLLWSVVNTSIISLKTEITTTINKQKEVDEGVQVETLRFESDSACQVNTLPGLSRMTSITPKDAYIYELAAAIKEVHSNLESLEKAVNDPAKKPGSQVVSKLLSNSQSSVELMNHLSTLLITECFCTNEEAEVNEVAELCAQYETLVALWKARERQQQDSNR